MQISEVVPDFLGAFYWLLLADSVEKVGLDFHDRKVRV